MRSIMFYLFWCKKIRIPQAWIQVGTTDTAWCNQPPGLWSSCSPRWGPLFPGAAAGNESLQAADVPWSMGLGSSEAPMKMMNMMNMMKTDEKWSNMVKWCMCRWSKSRSLTHGEKAREREWERDRFCMIFWDDMHTMHLSMVCPFWKNVLERWGCHSAAASQMEETWHREPPDCARANRRGVAWLQILSLVWWATRKKVGICHNYVQLYIKIYIYKQLDATVFHHVFTVLLMCGLSFP